MNPNLEPELQRLAEMLAGGGVLAYRRDADGRLVVINSAGQKLTFTPEEVHRALERLHPRPKPQGGKRP